MFSHFNPGNSSSQAKYPVGSEPVIDWSRGGSVWNGRRLKIGDWFLVQWEGRARAGDRVKLNDVLDGYPHGVPEPVRTRYGLEDDFRRLQSWRGRRSGMWRRFRTTGRDAEIKRLVRLGNSMRSIADLYGLSVGAVHYIVHRDVEVVQSVYGRPTTVRVVRKSTRRKVVHAESCSSLRERSLSLTSGLLNTPRAWLRICENMMNNEGWQPPNPVQKGQFELFKWPTLPKCRRLSTKLAVSTTFHIGDRPSE